MTDYPDSHSIEARLNALCREGECYGETHWQVCEVYFEGRHHQVDLLQVFSDLYSAWRYLQKVAECDCPRCEATTYMITAQRPVVLDHACPNPRCCVCDIDADWIGEGVEIGVWPNITPSRDTYRTCDEYHLAVQPDWPPVPQELLQ